MWWRRVDEVDVVQLSVESEEVDRKGQEGMREKMRECEDDSNNGQGGGFDKEK